MMKQWRLWKDEFFRRSEGAAWRLAYARDLTKLPDAAGITAYDALAQQYAAYLRMQDSPCAALRFPAFAQADAIQESAQLRRAAMLLVLADAPLVGIAERLGHTADAAQAWEALYFDVRSLRKAVSWIEAHVCEPERVRGNTALVVELKLAAAVGMVAIGPLLDGVAHLPTAEAERLHAQQLQLTLKFEECMHFPLTTPEERMAFLKLCMTTDLRTRQLALQERKLADRCAAAQRRHELQLQQLELQRRELELLAHHPESLPLPRRKRRPSAVQPSVEVPEQQPDPELRAKTA